MTQSSVPNVQVQSPCVRQCTLNSDDICVGCGRTLSEITQWSLSNEQQQRQIINNANIRLSTMG